MNAIELLPIFEFNELENYSLNPATQEYRVNFWGYSTVAFFAPMARYASGGGAGNYGRDSIREFKMLVRECHRRGIEVRNVGEEAHCTHIILYICRERVNVYALGSNTLDFISNLMATFNHFSLPSSCVSHEFSPWILGPPGHSGCRL